MTSKSLVPIGSVLLLSLSACSSPVDDPYESLTTANTFTTNAHGETDDEVGDGDGDPSGDGDGDPPGDGDGDPPGDGDGDPPGDGDGDPSGDGDGDPSGDGDGDSTGDGDGDTQTTCGWNGGMNPPGYYCAGMGEDPANVSPINCPANLVEGGTCGIITAVGCCDGEGHAWWCNASLGELVKDLCF